MVSSTFKKIQERRINAGRIPRSLHEALVEDPDRWIQGINKKNIKDFNSFSVELNRVLGENNARAYIFQDLDKEVLRILFNSSTVRSAITANVGKKKADKIYSQETFESYPTIMVEQQKLKPVAPAVRLRNIQGYNRGGQRVKGYQRAQGRGWTNAQVRFLQVRKQKQLRPADIIREYNSVFAESRSYESLRKKFYRI